MAELFLYSHIMYIKYFANYVIVLILKKQLLQPYIQKILLIIRISNIFMYNIFKH